MTQSSKNIDLSFTHLEFFDAIVISTIKEDVLVDENHVEELREVCVDHFENKEFVYVANRKNDYNVNPVIYINLLKTNTLKGIAVISENIERLKTANFEKQFSPVPFELFQNKEEAIVWATGI
jgi:hypothetical protein